MAAKTEMIFYFPYGERYHSLAQSFYWQYKEACKVIESDALPKDLLDSVDAKDEYHFLFECKENMAISAIIFEALAIEAYVNFWGAAVLGDDVFYAKYEPDKAKRKETGEKNFPKTTLDKIKRICKDEFKHPYPTDQEHFRMLKQLFDDRDRLVHYKPKGHLIKRPDPNQIYTLGMEKEAYKEYTDACEELNFIYANIDNHMCLYQQVKDNLQVCSGKTDPYLQMVSNLVDMVQEEQNEMLRKCGLKDVKKE